jgi:cell wall-associated NlpC family hydrolase
MPSRGVTAGLKSYPARPRGGFAVWPAAIAAIALCLGPLLAAEETSAPGASMDRQAAQIGDALAAQGVSFSYEIYQVCPGDTVENVAARFGVSAASVRQFNNLGVGSLSPGGSIAIPLSAKPVRAPVAAGPSLNLLEPSYAAVKSSCAITSEPGTGGTGILYEPRIGSQLIVNAQQGDYLGVVMIDGSFGWVPASAVEMTGRKLPSDQLENMLRGGRPDVVQAALRYLGTPYRYGGRLPNDVDCSLLVQTAFATCGTHLPRTAAQQYEVGRGVNYTELVPGDRLYFVSRSGSINHTGIYIGNGRFVHASSRRDCVAVDALDSPLYWNRFLGARR